MANLSPVLLNNVYSTVQAGSSAIGSSTATGINVATGDGANFGSIGTNQYIPAVVVDTSTSPETVKEYVYITSRSTDALTVTRQAEESGRYPASTTTIAAGYVIAAVGTFTGLATLGGVPGTVSRDQGFLSWNFDPLFLTGNGTLANVGTISLIRVPVPVTMSVTNVVMWGNSGGSGLTSGQNFTGIYDSSGNRLAVSADQTTAWGAFSDSQYTCALSGGPITVTGGVGAFVYVALVCNGTTAPQFKMVSSLPSAVKAGTTAATRRWAVVGTSGNTSLPSTLTLSSNSNLANGYWVALS